MNSSTPFALCGIGITIGLHQENESLWNNGIKQNAVYLAEALKHCPSVASVHLVNTTAVAITAALPWDQARWPTVTFEQGHKGQPGCADRTRRRGGVSADQTAYLKTQGCRLISYCCGFEYVHVMQSILFNRPLCGVTTCSSTSATTTSGWCRRSPPTAKSYFETLRQPAGAGSAVKRLGPDFRQPAQPEF